MNHVLIRCIQFYKFINNYRRLYLDEFNSQFFFYSKRPGLVLGPKVRYTDRTFVVPFSLHENGEIIFQNRPPLTQFSEDESWLPETSKKCSIHVTWQQRQTAYMMLLQSRQHISVYALRFHLFWRGVKKKYFLIINYHCGSTRLFASITFISTFVGHQGWAAAIFLEDLHRQVQPRCYINIGKDSGALQQGVSEYQ
jgi:hypothetical protein